MTILQGSIVPGSVKVSWLAGETAKVAQADTAGVFTGDGTGSVDYNTGAFSMDPVLLPAIGTNLTYEWVKQGTKQEVSPAALSLSQTGNSVSGVIPVSPLYPGQAAFTLQLDVGADVEVLYPYSLAVYDDGEGHLYQYQGGGRVTLGAINYQTGSFQITAPSSAKFMVKVYGYRQSQSTLFEKVWSWLRTEEQSHPATLRAPGIQSCRYLPTSSPSNCSKTYPLTALTLDFTPNSREVLVSGSVRLRFGGRTYVDREGQLYSNIDPMTGSGEQSGTIDYQNGVVSITRWDVGAENSQVVVESLLTSVDEHTVSSVAFRTPGAPVRPGSLYIRCLDATGGSHDVTAPSDGRINSDIFEGTVDYETGVVLLRFGRLVKASENLDAEWYDQNLVDAGGNIWKPTQINAASLRFNCVIYSSLPLDADLIGLDPVRLPTDGRVPIFRDGGLVVVHSTEKTAVPNNPSAGTVVNVGRSRLSHLHVEDSTGEKLPVAAYQFDLDAGRVTFTSSLSLSGLNQPLWVVHRIEDMSLLRDVEINGRLSLARPLSHDYPASSTLVSSVLIAGDRQARYTNLFDQNTWTNEWADHVIGDETSAQFNDTLYPIIVTNRGAITEDWALIFTSSNSFRIIGKSVGQIGAGDITSQSAPGNPATGVPYWVINPLGWGAGWSVGNVLRFKTIGAEFPVQIARTIMQSQASMADDKFELQIRGNVNK